MRLGSQIKAIQNFLDGLFILCYNIPKTAGRGIIMLENQPTKIYRGTWDELMNHRSEISPNAVLEVRVYEPKADPQIDQENQAIINLLRSWREEDATDDPQELESRDVETDELMANLKANRLSLRETEL